MVDVLLTSETLFIFFFSQMTWDGKGNVKEWETTRMGMGMSHIPMAIDSH